MRILVVSATEFEIGDLRSEVGNQSQGIDFLVTGVGMVATAFSLGRHLAANQYDLAINLGIAGSFDRDVPLGEVVEVIEDCFSEFGAEDDETFLPIETLGFGESIFKTDTRLSTYTDQQLKQVSAITVNTVHGHDPSIQKLIGRIQPQLESMEGAAFFYACKQVRVPCLQIRAVSNYVEKRNRDAWQIGFALKNLNTFVGELIKALSNDLFI